MWCRYPLYNVLVYNRVKQTFQSGYFTSSHCIGWSWFLLHIAGPITSYKLLNLWLTTSLDQVIIVAASSERILVAVFLLHTHYPYCTCEQLHWTVQHSIHLALRSTAFDAVPSYCISFWLQHLGTPLISHTLDTSWIHLIVWHCSSNAFCVMWDHQISPSLPALQLPWCQTASWHWNLYYQRNCLSEICCIHLWFKRPNMFCIVMNHNVDLLSWWLCKEWRIEVKLLKLNLPAWTAALLLWDWGKAVVFLRSRDGGTCDELWLDFAEIWLHLRLVQLQTTITAPNKVWALLRGVVLCTVVYFTFPG